MWHLMHLRFMHQYAFVVISMYKVVLWSISPIPWFCNSFYSLYACMFPSWLHYDRDSCLSTSLVMWLLTYSTPWFGGGKHWQYNFYSLWKHVETSNYAALILQLPVSTPSSTWMHFICSLIYQARLSSCWTSVWFQIESFVMCQLSCFPPCVCFLWEVIRICGTSVLRKYSQCFRRGSVAVHLTYLSRFWCKLSWVHWTWTYKFTSAGKHQSQSYAQQPL